MSNLKHIDFSKSTIEANGKTYQIEKEMSISRYLKFEELQNKLGWGVDFGTLYGKLSKIYEALNKSKPADAAVMVSSILEMIREKLSDRIIPALQLVTLFLNTPDEDRKVWDENLAEAKIKDIEAEGYDINDFFVLALNLVDGLVPVLNETSQTISEQEKTKEGEQ